MVSVRDYLVYTKDGMDGHVHILMRLFHGLFVFNRGHVCTVCTLLHMRFSEVCSLVRFGLDFKLGSDSGFQVQFVLDDLRNIDW